MSEEENKSQEEETLTIVTDSVKHSITIDEIQLASIIREAVHTEYSTHSTHKPTPKEAIALATKKAIHLSRVRKAEVLIVTLSAVIACIVLSYAYGDMLSEAGFKFLEEFQVALYVYGAERAFKLCKWIVGLDRNKSDE